MKTIKLQYLPLLLLLAVLLLAGNLQGQNEDPCSGDPQGCMLFVRAAWENLDNRFNPDPSKALRRVTFAPFTECDSIFVMIGTAQDKGEVLNIKGKNVTIDFEHGYVDFGTYGKIYINESTKYVGYIEFDLALRKDRDQFIYVTIRAKDKTGKKWGLWAVTTEETLATYSSIKSQLQFAYSIDSNAKQLHIQYQLPTLTNATLAIYSTSGILLKPLESKVTQFGNVKKDYSILGVTSGLYVLQVVLGDKVITEKINIQ